MSDVEVVPGENAVRDAAKRLVDSLPDFKPLGYGVRHSDDKWYITIYTDQKEHSVPSSYDGYEVLLLDSSELPMKKADQP